MRWGGGGRRARGGWHALARAPARRGAEAWPAAWHAMCRGRCTPENIVRARLLEESLTALRLIVRMGMTESEAVRTALVEAAAARSTDESLRAECGRRVGDPEQLTPAMRVRREMDEARPAWPDWGAETSIGCAVPGRPGVHRQAAPASRWPSATVHGGGGSTVALHGRWAIQASGGRARNTHHGDHRADDRDQRLPGGHAPGATGGRGGG